jgi:membrane associated rhomboid family serine protease
MRVPIITAVAVGVAVVAAVVQYAVPAVVPVLQRESWAVATDQWWRLVTPLFVQTLGWHQVAMNLITLALIGAIVERRLGRPRWAILFAAGTVGGQAAAFAWQLPGGGDSIAICGLAGGMVVWLLADRAAAIRNRVGGVPTDRPVANRSRVLAGRVEVGVVVCYVAALAGWGFGGVRDAAVAVVVAGVAVLLAPAWVGLLGAVACAVALATAADLHGVALLSGMSVGLVLTLWPGRSTQHGHRGRPRGSSGRSAPRAASAPGG